MKPRTLFIDIETAPLIIAAWQLWEANAVWVERDTYILSFSAKWADEKKVRTFSLPDFPAYRKDPHNDRDLVGRLFSFLDEADIVVAHNGDRFDIPKINARFAIHGLRPPSPYKSFDTLKLARKFKFDSSKLDNLGRYLGCGRKVVTTGADLWRRCTSDKYDRKAWKRMVRYNEMDVRLLERVYLKLRPWSTTHPNMAALTEKPCCPVCQSNHIQRRGFNLARTKKTPRFNCTSCGNWFSRSQREDRRTRPL